MTTTNIIDIKEIEKTLIDIAIKISRQGKGCIFVIMKNKFDYEPLIQQDIKPFDITENQRRLEALAGIDGACIIDLSGQCVAYSVKIMNAQIWNGHGTRHAAAYTSSRNDNISIMASEEDRKVKIFKGGILAMQVDPLEKNVEYKTKEAVNILESIGFGAVGAIGTAMLIPAVGLALIPGIIVYGSSYYLLKLLIGKK